MKIDKKDVQCICYYHEPHKMHKPWMEAVSSRKVLPYVPLSLMWTKKIPLINQLVPFLYGFFIPSAKVYLIEGPAMVADVFFKKGKVISINSDTFFYNKKRSRLIKFYSKLIVPRIDGFISTSKMMDDYARSVRKKSEIVYPFLSNENLFRINPKFGNDNICLVAGTQYIKGIDILLDVFKRFKDDHPDSKLYVLGLETEWSQKIRDAGGITPGFVDPKRYLKECSIYINPARHESFGANIIEAMAAGIPPLISENCGAKDFVEKIDKKLIIPLDAKEIIRRAEWLKNDKKRYFRLSKECKKAAKHLTKERSVHNFIMRFEKLLEA